MNLYAFNRGLISRLALARADLRRYALSAETMKNWMPRVLGSMMLRPGWGYIAAAGSNTAVRGIPFVFSASDTALIELTPSAMRVFVNDSLVTRNAVSSAVSNGTFDSDVSGWTDNDASGATSAWETGGYMALTGSGFGEAKRTQAVSTGDSGVEHAIRVTVERGPVRFKVGSSSGDDDYVTSTLLDTGYHSLAFTPTGTYYIELSHRGKYKVLVDSVEVESGGTMSLPTIWGESDLSYVRSDSSADVTFVSCKGRRLQKIERRSTTSWSVSDYAPENGPFLVENVDAINITPSALSGEITLSASDNIFRSTNVGSLYRLGSIGQQVTTSITAENQFSGHIRVTGVDQTRFFRIEVAGGVGTVTLQRSVAEPGSWVDVTSYATATTIAAYDDDLDNQVMYYRIGVKSGDYTSGTITASLIYAGGSIDGIVRVTGFTSTTVVSAQVLTELGGTDATDVWSEGAWSDRRGYPTALALYEGRLWFAGKDKIWGSIVDGFYSFDDEFEGDAGPISRSIGSGPVDTVNWLLPIQRLMIGTSGAEHSAKSSSFDEPLSPTNFNVRETSTEGSAEIEAVSVDSRGLYCQRSGRRIYELVYDAEIFDYNSVDITSLVPEVGDPGIKRLVIQRQPDTRIHAIRTDGTVACLVIDRAENVRCWIEIDTDGTVEDCVVLPGVEEDEVFYAVKRNSVISWEKWALESECRGGTVTKCLDSHQTFSSSRVVVASHLANKTVYAWADGKALGPFTADASGNVDLLETYTSIVLGLQYTAQFKSTKLVHTDGINRPERIDSIGFVLADTHKSGIQYGPSFTDLMDLPGWEGGVVADDYVWEAYDKDYFAFPGTWDADTRLCLQAQGPKPATVLGAKIALRN